MTAPRVHATGEHDSWGHVLMSRLPGVALATVWNELAVRERDVLATRLGETLATLHQLPPPQIPDWSPRARAPGGCGACPGRPSPRWTR